MKCQDCGEAFVAKKSTAANPYRFVESGLDHVYLIGATVLHCKTCKEYCAQIPKMGPLLDVIASTLLEKTGSLTGKELQYLRKHAGFQAQEFAALLHIDPAHLSRVETGKTNALGSTGDTLARLLIREAWIGGKRKEALLDFARRLVVTKETKATNTPTFKLVKNEWKEAA